MTSIVEFRLCNLTATKINETITCNYEYIGHGSNYGSNVRLLDDVYAKNDGYPNIKKGDLVYPKNSEIYINHVKNPNGYKVINKPVNR